MQFPITRATVPSGLRCPQGCRVVPVLGAVISSRANFSEGSHTGFGFRSRNSMVIQYKEWHFLPGLKARVSVPNI